MGYSFLYFSIFNTFDVGYQWLEDGSAKSIVSIVLSTLVVGAGAALIAADIPWNIFTGQLHSVPYQSVGLFIISLIFPLAAVVIFLILEAILVVKDLGDHKPLSKFHVYDRS